ncbi:zinc ABC transporter substrate-binding protein [Phycicoccus sp. BSK3Z-2]|uniref:Zinc ABC transporter substrate-binding protein n=1 Tax=Phycicoccus avicenniae TaxID=2828860 RepID=A0A941D9R3_9MICO|nr:metal ABC transporter substrate-binding protein [Phycicoccus avicenniae]MBR7744101.1 zinc ABC transporter substrate-binding protein [Phycicoccus avicenniae]
MKRRLPLLVLPTILALGACGGAASGDGAGSDGDPALEVSAAFYPLQWAAEQVGGDLVAVEPLTKPGAEPHDLELTPQDVAGMASSDVVLYLAGFQPAVDDAVDTEAADAGYDVSPEADLTLAATDDGHDHGHDHEGETAEEHAEHADEDGHDHEGETAEEHAEHADEDGHDHAGAEGVDPHFWLDPVRLQGVVTAIGERFAEADPDHAEDYRANAEATVAELATLDEEFADGLAQCRSDELVTGHAAFAYLADRYGLSQEGIAGLSPDAEPDAATLRELVEHVEEHDVSTIYSETLVSPALAETVARETGTEVAVLDPVEGLTDASAGSDYLEVMRSNLAVLQDGQQCT